MLPPPNATDTSDIPFDGEGSNVPALPPAWEAWLVETPSDEADLDWNTLALVPADSALLVPFTPPDQELMLLDRWIEEAQAGMNTPDGSRRLDDLLEERDWLAEELALQNGPQSALDVTDARFTGRVDLNAEGAVAGYTVQYMEVYQSRDFPIEGRLLDVGHYATADAAGKVFQVVQEGIDDGTLRREDMPYLAEALAESNGLPPDDWQEMTTEDHARFEAQSQGRNEAERDLPPDAVTNDPAFASNVFREVAADPQFAAQEQARLANEQALAALRGIGLAVQTDFSLARDSFYDTERNERLVNGIFQQNPDDPTQNCRPMLVSLTASENGLGYAAQAIEFGQVGGLTDVQADHDRVQAALEEGGVTTGITAVEALDTEREISNAENVPPMPEIPAPSLEIS